MKLPWAKKYVPKKLSEIVGQDVAIRELIGFVKSFPASKAIILAGPTGVGKTASLHALANELGYETVELNASDTRNKRSIEETLLPACQQASIFGSKKLIIVDEVDGLSGEKDRGGASAVADVIGKTKFPVVLTANDAFSDKLKSLRKVCKLIQFGPIEPRLIAERLKAISSTEGIICEEKALAKLAYSAQGDLRAAINDLEMLGEEGRAINVDAVRLWGRAQDESISSALRLIFKSYDTSAAFGSVDNIHEDYDMLALWLDENMSSEYSGESARDAYNCISCADIFNSRIRRWQHWGFLVYVRSLLVAGVQQAKAQGSKCACKQYKRPSLLLKLWMRSMQDSKHKAEIEKFSEAMHTSKRRLKRDFFPFFNFIAQRNSKMAEDIMNSLAN